MQYTVTHDPNAQVITATAEGEWDGEQDDDLIREIIAAITATGIRRVLLDIQRLNNIDLSTLRLYDRAQALQSRRREVQAAAARVAIVYNASDTVNLEQFRFFETTARNRGLPYRLFEDSKAAIDWLAAA